MLTTRITAAILTATRLTGATPTAIILTIVKEMTTIH